MLLAIPVAVQRRAQQAAGAVMCGQQHCAAAIPKQDAGRCKQQHSTWLARYVLCCCFKNLPLYNIYSVRLQDQSNSHTDTELPLA